MPSVYALGDPRTGKIRYIGIAQDVYRRYAQHLNHPHHNDVLLMYDARDLARRKTNMRRPNRMPYFFTCLRRACAESKDRIAA